MSQREAHAWILRQLREQPELDFVLDQDILTGERKHESELVRYQINVMPSGNYQPASKFTMQSRSTPQYTTGAPRISGTKYCEWRFHLDLYVRVDDPYERLMGGKFGPGMYDFEALVKLVIERDWRYKKTITKVEFESTQYQEFPPPKAMLVLVIGETVRVDDPLGLLGPEPKQPEEIQDPDQ